MISCDTAASIPPKRKSSVTHSVKTTDLSCTFCKKVYKTELGLSRHTCIQKTREENRNLHHVRFAHNVFNRFLEVGMRQKPKPYEDFRKSRLYQDFIKVSQHFIDVNIVDTPAFVDYLVKRSIPIERWVRADVYTQYLKEYTRSEAPDDAIRRNLLLMEQWGRETDRPWNEFLREVGCGKAVLWIKTGRLSPWLIHISDSAIDLLSRFSDEQLYLVAEDLDPDFWNKRIARHQDIVEKCRLALKEGGV